MGLFFVISMSLKMSRNTILVAFGLKTLTLSHFLQKMQNIVLDWALSQGGVFFWQ